MCASSFWVFGFVWFGLVWCRHDLIWLLLFLLVLGLAWWCFLVVVLFRFVYLFCFVLLCFVFVFVGFFGACSCSLIYITKQH